jgi:predicted peptidase
MTCRRVLLTVLLCLIAPSVFARKRETGFLDRTVSVNARVYRYQVFVPQNYDPHKKWPVILFLHGLGERGDDGLLQTDIGIGHAIRKGVSRFPFIVVDDPRRCGPLSEIARRIGSTPIWIFHGDADDTVSVEESRKMAQALQAAKANVRYTEYPGVGHNAWG